MENEILILSSLEPTDRFDLIVFKTQVFNIGLSRKRAVSFTIFNGLKAATFKSKIY